ncbi:MAG TPA: RsmD family RNA methyltransferase [Bacteroidales bacterium]|jgi:16S rRNA (guanine(966)-N(2))-methyltransferase RsmD|nr:RsmD family RNA methyltransferase [Bacteroidales bacterium]
MRIISGTFKGKQIIAPSFFTLRPTTDFAKESLCNILSNMYDFDDCSLLDLFAGIGSISLEFASRGCTDIVCVEREPKHAGFIKKTVSELKIQGMHVVTNDVRDFLKIAYRSFSVIFADPPYDLPWIQSIPDYIFSSKAVDDQTFVIIEHPASVSYVNHEFYIKTKQYGKVHFSMFSKEKE